VLGYHLYGRYRKGLWTSTVFKGLHDTRSHHSFTAFILFVVKVYHLRKFFSVPGVVDEALSLFSSLPFCVVVPNTSLFFIDGLILDTKHLYDKLINVLMTRLSAVRKLKYIDGSVRTKI